MRRVLLVSHDAGGTIPPMLALAEELVGRGHQVTWLAQPSVRERAVGIGAEFVGFGAIPDYDPSVAIEEQLEVALPVLTAAALGEEALATADAASADLVVVDANLGGVLAALENDPRPSAVLLHSLYETFVSTWFVDIWPLVADLVNATRASFGLAARSSWAGLFSAHDRILSVVPARFDGSPALPPQVRHCGFLVPRPPRRRAADAGSQAYPGAPEVVVGLSTTYLAQGELMQSIVDALALLDVPALVSTGRQMDPRTLRVPGSVTVREFVDYRRAFLTAGVMVTHAGLGSVAAALDSGIPLVCTPIARDQHLNASRVQAVAAGVVVDAPLPEPRAIASAIDAVASDPSYLEAARAIAHGSREAGGAPGAVDDLLSLLP